MALQDVLDSADARFQQHWPTVQNGQEQWHSQNGRYWQGLVSHSEPNIPKDGTEATADRLTVAPSDQPTTWDEMMSQFGLSIGTDWLQALRIDSYRSEQGDGYVAVRRLEYDGTEYVKRVDEGSLSQGHDWREAPESTL